MSNEQIKVVVVVCVFVSLIFFLVFLAAYPPAFWAFVALVGLHVVVFLLYRFWPVFKVRWASKSSARMNCNSESAGIIAESDSASVGDGDTEHALSPRASAVERPLNEQEVARLSELRRELGRVEWRMLEGDAFTKFVANAFEVNRCVVVPTATMSEFGIDMVVTSNKLRYAVAARAMRTPVGNAVVMQVLAGLTPHHCDKGLVVTNGTFTVAAADLAQKRDVLLIDRSGIANLLNGKLI